MPQPETAQRILDAATELFLQQGYGATNLEQVAAKAGVTKPTVYSHFGSKEGLLEAMIQRHADTRVDHFAEQLAAAGDTEQKLTRFAKAFVATIMSDQARAWQRLGTAESARYPEVGATFFRAGPRRVFRFLSEFLREEQRAGRLNFPDAEQAAEQFLGMLIGLDLMRSLVGQPISSPTKRGKRVRETVSIFLRVYGTES